MSPFGKYVSKQSATAQMMRFILVGGVIYAIDFLSFYFLTTVLDAGYIASNFAAKTVGALAGFFLHKYITYSWRQVHNAGSQLIRYTSLFGINAIAANVFLYIFASLSLPVLVGKVVSDVIVIVMSFLIGRYFVFSGHN